MLGVEEDGRSRLRGLTTGVYWGVIFTHVSNGFPGQCALPVFENLLPEPHNSQIQQLLFLLCHWHALAKLRMHTDSTLDVMERLTVCLAQQMRKFASETCPAFVTKELRREADSRRRREAQGGSAKTTHSPASDVRRLKTLNLQTYKMHALGDYHNQIRMFGTTDSFSTQTVSFRYVVLR